MHIGETRHVKTIHLLRSKGYENVHGWASTAYFSVWHLVNSTEALRPVPSAPAEAGIGVTWGGEFLPFERGDQARVAPAVLANDFWPP